MSDPQGDVIRPSLLASCNDERHEHYLDYHSMTRRRLARFLCSVLVLIKLVQGIVFPQWGRAVKNLGGFGGAAPDAGGGGGGHKSSTPATTAVLPKTIPTAPSLAVSIRKTSREDLSKVAAFLATAAAASSPAGGHQVGFRARIDRIFAKDDIQKLLESRYMAIYEAQRSWNRLLSQHKDDSVLIQNNDNDDNKSKNDDDPEKSLSSSSASMLLWRHWWSTSDRLRATIASAVALTAEPTLFDQGSTMDLTPQPYALQHVQLTAVPSRRRRGINDITSNNNNHINSNMPIGFCEVAMEPPLGRPLILNVAVDPRYRRRGVARRLLRTTERYVRRHWEIGSCVVEPGIGLYVDPANTAALELYQSLGYATVTANSSSSTADDDVAGMFVGPRDQQQQQNNGRSLTYMFKAFRG
jgi:ribosomal protein S18 acetylase RimI-like enzyme